MLRIFLAILAVVWIGGMIWAGNATKDDELPLWWRIVLIVLWPFTWLVSKCIVIPALAAGCALGLLLSLPQPSRADAIAKRGDDWVRIMAAACTNEAVRAAITMLGGEPDQFLAATARLHGQNYQACWRPIGTGAFLVYDDGDQGVVPQAALKPVPEA